MKRALTIGINDYPKAPLRGCVNDAEGWGAFFRDVAGFDRVKTLLNREAKMSAVTREIRAMLEVSGPGDVVRIQYSGHGTRVPDKDGDEADGYDEALVLYDGIWLDDQVADLLLEMPDGVDLAFISDSCHSGTVSRSLVQGGSGRPRFLPYPGAEVVSAVAILHRLFASLRPKPPAVPAADEAMNHVLLAGASPVEYAWDSSFNGQPWGALSYHALSILNEKPNLTWDELHRRIRGRLPSTDAPQSPQLEGPASALLRRVRG
jgi:metacaspase-1